MQNWPTLVYTCLKSVKRLVANLVLQGWYESFQRDPMAGLGWYPKFGKYPGPGWYGLQS
jgi:hypothetical protein